jgi:hypothetical protein
VIIEMRRYYCCPARMPALQARFKNHTLGFFRKHGIRPIGFWITAVGEDNHELMYLLEWTDMGEREARWNAFQSDPEWIARRAESEAEKPILARVSNQFLSPCAFFANSPAAQS